MSPKCAFSYWGDSDAHDLMHDSLGARIHIPNGTTIGLVILTGLTSDFSLCFIVSRGIFPKLFLPWVRPRNHVLAGGLDV